MTRRRNFALGLGSLLLCAAFSAPVLEDSVPKAAFTLSRFSTAAPTWTALGVTTKYLAATTTTPPRLELKLAAELDADRQYRLALDPTVVTPATPISDDKMRPLRPLRGVFQFGIDKLGGALVLVDAPYAR